MTEVRVNARYIFWSGALAFHGPKIIFFHDKNKEFLVENSSCILCTFVYPWCYGRLKYGKIKRTNGIGNIVYFTRVVTNERKFRRRWYIVPKLLQGRLYPNKAALTLGLTNVIGFGKQSVEGITIRHFQQKHLAIVLVSLYSSLFIQKTL